MEFEKIAADGYDPADVDAYVTKLSGYYTHLYEIYGGQQTQINRMTWEAQAVSQVYELLSAEIDKSLAEPEPQAKIPEFKAEQRPAGIEPKAAVLEFKPEQRVAEVESQVRLLECKKEELFGVIRQLASGLTALTG